MNMHSSLNDWLEQFAACVRSRDIEAGKALFTPDAQGFGTRTEWARDRAQLIEHQWRQVWSNTREFRFLPDPIVTMTADDDSLVCVLALWDSQGIATTGDAFPRRGRSTILLKRDFSAPHGYLAIHTHFSKTPAGTL